VSKVSWGARWKKRLSSMRPIGRPSISTWPDGLDCLQVDDDAAGDEALADVAQGMHDALRIHSSDRSRAPAGRGTIRVVGWR
jgi:hypothetical protein